MQQRADPDLLGRRCSRLASRTIALLGVVAAAAALSACTAQPPTNGAYDAWFDRMQTVFGDSDGNGGGGAAAPGSVELPSTRPGEWVVYAVCADTDLVHVRIQGGTRTLAESDVPCGATVAMPITVDRAAARRFEITTTGRKGTSGSGWWSVQVNSTSWKQTPSFVFD